jgi:hypothetical protein
MARLKLSSEEKEKLLNGIKEAQRRLANWDGDITEEDARLLLKETLSDALVLVLKNHKSERQLN